MYFKNMLELIKPFITVNTFIVFCIILFFIVLICKLGKIYSNIKDDKGLFLHINPKERSRKVFNYSCKVIISKIYFFVRSIFHYIFCKNIILNLILILLMILIKDCFKGRLFGPVFGSLITINIVNYYNYYSRQIKFNNIKKSIFTDLKEFIIKYMTECLSYDSFPIYTNNCNEHKPIQNDFFKYYEHLDILLKKYEDYFNKINKSKPSLPDKDKIKKYLKLFFDYKIKIFENINTTKILFPENLEDIKLLSDMKNKYNLQIEIGQHILNGDNLEDFLDNVIDFIKKLKEVYIYINDVWY